MDEKVKQWAKSLKRSDALELLRLLVETNPLAQGSDFRQDIWIAAYLDNNCSVPKACKAVRVSIETYKGWTKEINFQAKVQVAEKSLADDLFAVAREKALKGDNEMLKLLLAALDPERFDSKFRSQVKANEGQLAAIMEGNKTFTDEEIRRLLASDPAQQYVPRQEDPGKH